MNALMSQFRNVVSTRWMIAVSVWVIAATLPTHQEQPNDK